MWKKMLQYLVKGASNEIRIGKQILPARHRRVYISPGRVSFHGELRESNSINIPFCSTVSDFWSADRRSKARRSKDVR